MKVYTTDGQRVDIEPLSKSELGELVRKPTIESVPVFE